MNQRTERSFVQEYGLYLAWLVAIIATASSLFLSEVMLFEPCRLCWFQRIFMYPLVLWLGIAAYRNDRSIIRYALPMSIIGGCISIYHYAEQKIPAFAKLLPCKVGVPCNADYLDWFGFITIPLLALIAFALITIFLFVARRGEDPDLDMDEEEGINREWVR
ncbi:disulfide bond formation protein DsbB [Paenibacillus shirakamiensis]|uniref:Disulfide bond formation protein DsbB n=1 Tax=Paenibacillus shirakamiensis TaxID=1265935 RepID=A0ABS4JBI4_9BACL|nr:disulfide oxidoreductase [Paenibacillus shirakamiensis]MBP1999063.1 disulfide bond formation protein DsbB [Paenibacillus shirakamiensis]